MIAPTAARRTAETDPIGSVSLCSEHMFATVNGMHPFDICDETEWLLTAADVDMLVSGVGADAEFRLADPVMRCRSCGIHCRSPGSTSSTR